MALKHMLLRIYFGFALEGTKYFTFVEGVEIIPNSPDRFTSQVHQKTSLLVIQHFTAKIFLRFIHIFILYLFYFVMSIQNSNEFFKCYGTLEIPDCGNLVRPD